MNVVELLADLQARHDEATTRAGELRDRIEYLTAALAETEARLTDLATTRKVIAELVPIGAEPEPPESAGAYQAILNAFNEHPGQAFRVRDLHELLGMPTDDPAMKEASRNTAGTGNRSKCGHLILSGDHVSAGRHSHCRGKCAVYRGEPTEHQTLLTSRFLILRHVSPAFRLAS
ncbi:hypothetical protein [Streptomyces hirsutus]|uniref:hypothetical protein n=1 Tax=Streptomyces hirsutus TaxID=35620 RepID=UPI0033192396